MSSRILNKYDLNTLPRMPVSNLMSELNNVYTPKEMYEMYEQSRRHEDHEPVVIPPEAHELWKNSAQEHPEFELKLEDLAVQKRIGTIPIVLPSGINLEYDNLYSSSKLNCGMCMKKCEQRLTCENCHRPTYCSEECKQKHMEKGHMSSCTPAPTPNPTTETSVKFVCLVDEEDLDDLPELVIEAEQSEKAKQDERPEQSEQPEQGKRGIFRAAKVPDYLFHPSSQCVRAPAITYPQIAEELDSTETHSTKNNVHPIVPDPLSKFRVWKGEEERDAFMSHSSAPLGSRFRTNGTTRPGAAPERDAWVSHSQSLNLLVRNDEMQRSTGTLEPPKQSVQEHREYSHNSMTSGMEGPDALMSHGQSAVLREKIFPGPTLPENLAIPVTVSSHYEINQVLGYDIECYSSRTPFPTPDSNSTGIKKHPVPDQLNQAVGRADRCPSRPLTEADLRTERTPTQERLLRKLAERLQKKADAIITAKYGSSSKYQMQMHEPKYLMAKSEYHLAGE